MGLLAQVPFLPRSYKYKELGSLPPAIYKIDAHMETKYTPDIGKLEQKLTWLMFAYDYFSGSEVKDYNIHVFTRDRFKMWKQDLGKYSLRIPFLVPESYQDTVPRPIWADPNPFGSREPLASRIRGTLHLVSPEMIISLDKDMHNTVRFERIRVPLLYPYQRAHRKVTRQVMTRREDGKPYLEKRYGDWTHERVVGNLEAWMYVAVEKHWSPMMESDSLRSMFRPAKLIRPESGWISDCYVRE